MSDQPTPIKRRLRNSSFGVAAFKCNTWRATLDENQSIDDAMNSAFWIDQADQIMGQDKTNPKGRGDLIQIWKPDTSQFLEVIITAIGSGYVKVAMLRGHEPAPAAVVVPDSSPLTIKWNVGKRAHDVIRKTDNAVMHGGFQTKADAAEWIANHLKAMAA